MCAARKKKNERNEIVCFRHKSGTLLCGIARFSRGNKNELRRFNLKKEKKNKNSQPQTKSTCSYKRKSVVFKFLLHIFIHIVLVSFKLLKQFRKHS